MKLAVVSLALIAATVSVGLMARAPAYGTFSTRPLPFGDVNCDQSLTAQDAGLLLSYIAGIPKGPLTFDGGPCPTVGEGAPISIVLRIWGDNDCSGAVTPIDALAILRRLTLTAFTTPTNFDCPSLGAAISLNDSTPTPTLPVAP